MGLVSKWKGRKLARASQSRPGELSHGEIWANPPWPIESRRDLLKRSLAG